MISIEERNEEDEMDNINTEVQETVETGTEPAPKKRGRASAKDAAEKADKKTVAKKTTAEKAETRQLPQKSLKKRRGEERMLLRIRLLSRFLWRRKSRQPDGRQLRRLSLWLQ